jgi:peroxiredoxin family protein
VEQQQVPTLAIIFLSKDLEKLHAGSLVGSVAAMSGMKVRMFVTMNALEAFLKENVEKQNFQTGTVGAEMLNKNIPLFPDLIKEGKENGDLHLYGCSMAMDVMGWKQGDLIDLFDDVIGVSSFLGMAQGAQVITM